MKTLINAILRYMNICATCNKEFQTDNINDTYCSSACAG